MKQINMSVSKKIKFRSLSFPRGFLRWVNSSPASYLSETAGTGSQRGGKIIDHRSVGEPTLLTLHTHDLASFTQNLSAVCPNFDRNEAVAMGHETKGANLATI